MDRTVPRLSDLTNYVYEAKGGAGIYIYHVGEVSLAKAHMTFKTSDSVYTGRQYPEDNRKARKVC